MCDGIFFQNPASEADAVRTYIARNTPNRFCPAGRKDKRTHIVGVTGGQVHAVEGYQTIMASSTPSATSTNSATDGGLRKACCFLVTNGLRAHLDARHGDRRGKESESPARVNDEVHADRLQGGV